MNFLSLVQSAGIFICSYSVLTTILVPGWPFGLLFGFGWGSVYSIIGATVGAAGAFALTRYVARDRLQRRLRRKPKYSKLMKAIEDRGWK